VTTNVAVLWHMHQPSYRDPLDGTFILPWVRLHALKDYWGMVELLAETPQVRVTFNLVPSLLDQLDAYVSGEAREAELRLGLFPADRLDESEKVYLLRAAFMAHPENLIGRFPRFAELLALRGPRNDEASLRIAAPRFGAAEMRDLQVLDVLASGRQVVAQVVIEFAYPNGGVLRDEELHLWTFGADGLITALRHYVDTAKHLAAAEGADTTTP